MKKAVVGYNTGVQHRGHSLHIQTEDSGESHPHVITHLFADGGRVIATRRTDYSHHLATDRYPAIVKEIVLQQHKAMFLALRRGELDAVIGESFASSAPPAPAEPVEHRTPARPQPSPASDRIPLHEPSASSLDELILDELERFCRES